MPSLSRLFLALFSSLFLLTGASSAAPVKSVPVKAARPTPTGGFIIGSPTAKAQLVEYVSYTCPHCAQFEAVDIPKLQQSVVATSKASIEFRNYWRDGIDLTMAMLARCGGPAKFMANHRHIMATQAQWRARAGQLDPANNEHFHADYGTGAYVELDEMVTYMQGVFDQMKLADIVAPLKIKPAAARTCIADKVALRKILIMTDDAIITHGISGTPTFLYNGAYDPTLFDHDSIKARIDRG